jgi:hypothetical protein
MMASLRSRIYGLILLSCISLPGFSQWSDGPFLSLGIQGGFPLNKQVKAYSWAFGGLGKFSLPLGTNDYFTFSLNALSINGKGKGAVQETDKGLKEHDILSGFVGYRYDFRKEDATNYFFMEPQIGWTASGTDYNTFSVLPMVGYSLNAKIDFGLWYHASTTTQRFSKIGVLGVLVAYNFHFASRNSE